MIEIKNVSKSYGKKKVVQNVSLTVQKGTITSFIGPNGAGKSTLISMVSRLLSCDEGEVYIDGNNVTKTKSNELAKKISILKQSNELNVRLKVRELVSFGRFPYSQGRLSKDDWAYVDEAIRYMELEEIQDQFIDHLSGGQKQRAFIAMVIAQNTEYIILDEPLNNLDMKHSVQIMKVLRRLADELGKTVLIVIHDINFASVYSDQIVALKNGSLIREGRTEEMITTEVLQEIYDMHIPIEQYGDHRIGIYFS
ncbi:iron ABC transporter ATP-binding protein [Guptibacillus hwajinpoensis]|uniref:iron ABC transporter ATP-binding protein n=1 Tax=Guptibacillus hwajinpoensis TaxID=208199 RepID=UPI001CFD9CBA|nr:ABC transporter ATP-binding protein [Pseudalkalibacillus hwajinpoensis]WLR58875.1 ABC transporter ATP-binding protein [Pseudalkalibacillus hwajinpoensis]